jgi:hypothetical protein
MIHNTLPAQSLKLPYCQLNNTRNKGKITRFAPDVTEAPKQAQVTKSKKTETQ